MAQPSLGNNAAHGIRTASPSRPASPRAAPRPAEKRIVSPDLLGAFAFKALSAASPTASAGR